MKKDKKDHAISIFKAGVAGIPFVGGSLSSLIGDYVPSSTQKIIDNTIEKLGTKIEKLENRIDIENLDKEEFSELFKSTYLVIVRSHKQKKLDTAVNLLTNILLNKDDPHKLSYNELDHFSRILDQISIGSLEILGTVAKYIKDKYGDKISEIYKKDFDEKIRFNFGEIITFHPDMHPSLLMGLVSELNSHNLIHISGIPDIRTKNYSNYPIETTILGIRFIFNLLTYNENTQKT